MIYLVLGLTCMVTFVASGLYHSYREWQREEQEAEERNAENIRLMASLRWTQDKGWFHEDTPERDRGSGSSTVYETLTHC